MIERMSHIFGGLTAQFIYCTLCSPVHSSRIKSMPMSSTGKTQDSAGEEQ
jgi:hypothetical protein